MDDFLKKAFLVGLGALAITRERTEQLVKKIEAKGEVTSSELKELVNEMMEKGEESHKALTEFIKKEIERIKQTMGLATREEVNLLQNQLEKLEARLNHSRPGEEG